MPRRFVAMLGPVAIALLVGLPVTAHADAITTLFNTGVSAAGAPLPNNFTELHYFLAKVPSGSTSGVRVASSANNFPIGPWVGDDNVSAWIGPNSDSVLSSPAGNYDYRTTFNLSGLNAVSASIKGQWSADNYGTDILLNGISTGNTATDFRSFYNLSITSGFVAGLNTLDFLVYNAPGADSNPTGLRTELVGKADVPEPASMTLLGVGLFGLALTRGKRT